ncbi:MULTISPECIES: BrnA antitoxin family protein [unclassified Bradyrhizobium]|uniref:BrnA antitoxin family protein n=1 Tax=unclassified Bradyrhizobium TaxID=2631580 RepID=UPI0028ED47E7|nr:MULTISPECIES: BrnA antitoxin family protein [unclassified Bradyrhizobium]
MTKKNAKSAGGLVSKIKPSQWRDPDDAPEITDEMLDRATIVKGGKVIQRGRPPLGDLAKRTVTIRLDVDVVEAYRALGRGWQTQLNADLRRVRKLKAG